MADEADLFFCSGVGHHATGAPTSVASTLKDYSALRYQHWPESSYRRLVYPATHFPSAPSISLTQRYPALSHWLGRETDKGGQESKKVNSSPTVVVLLRPSEGCTERCPATTGALERLVIGKGFQEMPMTMRLGQLLTQAMGLDWVPVTYSTVLPSIVRFIKATGKLLESGSRTPVSRMDAVDELDVHHNASGPTPELSTDETSSPVLSDAYITLEDASTRTASYLDEIEFNFAPEDLRRSQENIRPRRSDASLESSLSASGRAGVCPESHEDVFSNQDLDFDASLQVLDRTFDDLELALCDPLAQHSTETEQEVIVTQEEPAALVSATSVETESSSQEREDQDAPSKSSRRPSIIRLLTLSETKIGRFTRRRKLSPTSEADGAPVPPAKRRRTASLLRSVYKVHERIRAVSLN